DYSWGTTLLLANQIKLTNPILFVSLVLLSADYKNAPIVKIEPIFCKKSEPILQNEPIRIFVSYYTITHRKRLRIGYNSESFSTKSTFSGGINRIYDEIRLDGGWKEILLQLSHPYCKATKIKIHQLFLVDFLLVNYC
ncbi:MAG: hypothetical protein IKD26_03975, partial [Clostridia bacterium]|nr:hypothetical protein [Clostridia bacterium]